MKTNLLLAIAFLVITRNANAQWQQTNCPYSGRTNCFAISGVNIFAGIENDGIYLSTDNGANWTLSNTGLTSTGVRALAISGVNIFAGTAGSGVFLSTNNGANWSAINTGLTSQDVRALMASSPYLNAGTNGGGDFGSSNNGAAWSPINTGLTDLHVTSIANAGGTNTFIGTPSGVFLLNYPNWSAVNNGLTNLDVYTLAGTSTALFAGTQGGGIFKTTNNGANWTAINTGLTFNYITSFAISGTNIYAGTNGGGIFLSTDNGNSWTAINTGLTYLEVYSLGVNGSYLFAGTNNNGIWKRALSEISGVNEINKVNMLEVYPNPSNERLTVTFYEAAGKQIDLSIFNALDQQMLTQRISGGQGKETIDVSQLPEGIYFVRLVSGGNVIDRKKIIITR